MCPFLTTRGVMAFYRFNKFFCETSCFRVYSKGKKPIPLSRFLSIQVSKILILLVRQNFVKFKRSKSVWKLIITTTATTTSTTPTTMTIMVTKAMKTMQRISKFFRWFMQIVYSLASRNYFFFFIVFLSLFWQNISSLNN